MRNSNILSVATSTCSSNNLLCSIFEDSLIFFKQIEYLKNTESKAWVKTYCFSNLDIIYFPVMLFVVFLRMLLLHDYFGKVYRELQQFFRFPYKRIFILFYELSGLKY
jgi:hypothetical protein